jgi:hypothetical protein
MDLYIGERFNILYFMLMCELTTDVNIDKTNNIVKKIKIIENAKQ